jgi:predicted DNA-binding transcriptional regulator AlpA
MGSFRDLQQLPTADADQPRTITIRDVRRRYGWGRTKTYELIGEGKLKAVKMGARLLVFVDSSEALVASLPPAKIAAPQRPQSSK